RSSESPDTLLGIAERLAEIAISFWTNEKVDSSEMNMSNVISREHRTRKERTPISSTWVKRPNHSCTNLRLRRVLGVITIIVVIVFVVLSSITVSGANPAEEMAKAGATGGIDPAGNSWLSIEKSLRQFAHPSFILRLFLSLTLAVGCAFAIAWHPRRASL